MATTNSRIGAYIKNFTEDNSGRTITQTYATFSNVSGTVSVVPKAQYNYYVFPNPITATLSINVGITYSTVDPVGNPTVSYNSQICDNVTFMFSGGATANIVYNQNIMGSATTVVLSNNKPTIITGIFNGTE